MHHLCQGTQQWPISKTPQRVDATALKVNQTCIVVLVVFAFILGARPFGVWLVGFVAVSLAMGTVLPGYGPFQLLYRRVLRPAGILQPHVRPDDPRPHRFSQALGAVFLTVATAVLVAGWDTVGWSLGWLVVVLALVNLLFGFCAGCFAFYQFQRLRHGASGSPA